MISDSISHFFNQRGYLDLFTLLLLFVAFLHVSSAMLFTTSDSRGFFKLLFLILGVPILYSSGACFIPSSISFCHILEVRALELMYNPFLNRFFTPNLIYRSASFSSPPLKNLPPFCACLVRLTVTFLCNCARLFCCFLGPIHFVRLTATFLGTFCLLVLS